MFSQDAEGTGTTGPLLSQYVGSSAFSLPEASCEIRCKLW